METIILTEAAIVGVVTQTAPAYLLRHSWIKASEELVVGISHEGMKKYRELLKEQPVISNNNFSDGKTILATESSFKDCLRVADGILNRRRDERVLLPSLVHCILYPQS